MTLPDEALAFTRSIGEGWRDLPGTDPASFQRRYLYAQAFGAAHTARSYWILHDAGQHSDCNVLGRKLLEYLFNSRVASKSPRNAVELIAYELSERIRRLRLLMGEHKRVPREVAADVQRLESELQVFLSMSGTHRVPQWDYHRRAVVARLSSWAYRGLYSKFSRYAHAGYEMSRPQEVNRPSGLADFIALLAPIDTAMCLHQLSCGQTPCEVLVKYKALCAEFRSKTLGR